MGLFNRRPKITFSEREESQLKFLVQSSGLHIDVILGMVKYKGMDALMRQFAHKPPKENPPAKRDYNSNLLVPPAKLL